MAAETEKQLVADWVASLLPAIALKIILVSDKDLSASPGATLEVPYVLIEVSSSFNPVGGTRHSHKDGVATAKTSVLSRYTVTYFGDDGEDALNVLKSYTRNGFEFDIAITHVGPVINRTGLDATSMEASYAQDFEVQSFLVIDSPLPVPLTNVVVDYSISDSRTPVPVPFEITYTFP